MAKHKSGKLRCPATALINIFGNSYAFGKTQCSLSVYLVKMNAIFQWLWQECLNLSVSYARVKAIFECLMLECMSSFCASSMNCCNFSMSMTSITTIFQCLQSFNAFCNNVCHFPISLASIASVYSMSMAKS